MRTSCRQLRHGVDDSLSVGGACLHNTCLDIQQHHLRMKALAE